MKYTAGTRPGTKITERVEAIEMQALRRILNKTWRDRARREDITEVCKVDYEYQNRVERVYYQNGVGSKG